MFHSSYFEARILYVLHLQVKLDVENFNLLGAENLKFAKSSLTLVFVQRQKDYISSYNPTRTQDVLGWKSANIKESDYRRYQLTPIHDSIFP